MKFFSLLLLLFAIPFLSFADDCYQIKSNRIFVNSITEADKPLFFTAESMVTGWDYDTKTVRNMAVVIARSLSQPQYLVWTKRDVWTGSLDRMTSEGGSTYRYDDSIDRFTWGSPSVNKSLTRIQLDEDSFIFVLADGSSGVVEVFDGKFLSVPEIPAPFIKQFPLLGQKR